MKFKTGVARSASGEPMISPELVVVINLPSVDNPDGSNVTVRGVSPMGIQMRERVKLAAGRWFEAGKREECSRRLARALRDEDCDEQQRARDRRQRERRGERKPVDVGFVDHGAYLVQPDDCELLPPTA